MFFIISGYLITTILLGEHARTSTINLRDFTFGVLSHPAGGGVFLLFAMIASLVTRRRGTVLPAVASALRRLYRHKVSLLLSVVAIGPIVDAFCRHFR